MNPEPLHPWTASPWEKYDWQVGIVIGPNPTGDLYDLLLIGGFDGEAPADRFAKLVSEGVVGAEVVVLERGQLHRYGYRRGEWKSYGFMPVLTIDTDNPNWPGVSEG